jgi:glycosyltransferase involved in cell wall biosynthesis
VSTPAPERVSVVVPAFNAAAHLPAALASILAQTVGPLEVIVADDGSTDATREIAAAHGAPVRVVTQPTAGPPATRNLGIRAACGDLLAFLDPDDLWAPEKTERQLAVLRARPTALGVVCHVQQFSDDGVVEERLRGHARMAPVPGYATGALLARREAFDVVGLLPEDVWFTDATAWFVRARELEAEIAVMDEVLAFHRLHAENLTRRRATESADEFLGLVKTTLDRRRAPR